MDYPSTPCSRPTGFTWVSVYLMHTPPNHLIREPAVFLTHPVRRPGKEQRSMCDAGDTNCAREGERSPSEPQRQITRCRLCAFVWGRKDSLDHLEYLFQRAYCGYSIHFFSQVTINTDWLAGTQSDSWEEKQLPDSQLNGPLTCCWVTAWAKSTNQTISTENKCTVKLVLESLTCCIYLFIILKKKLGFSFGCKLL